MAQKAKMECLECGTRFTKMITPHTFEVSCPHCHGVDTEPV